MVLIPPYPPQNIHFEDFCGIRRARVRGSEREVRNKRTGQMGRNAPDGTRGIFFYFFKDEQTRWEKIVTDRRGQSSNTWSFTISRAGEKGISLTHFFFLLLFLFALSEGDAWIPDAGCCIREKWA
jgi:hypothetical protein